MSNTALWLKNWFEENSGQKMLEQGFLEVDYFQQGYVDSIGFIELIDDIEENYKIEFSNKDFQQRSFSTIQGMVALIEGKREGAVE